MTRAAGPTRGKPDHTAPLRENDEADLSTEQSATETNSRLSRSYEHPDRPRRHQAAPRQGAQAPDRLDSSQAAPPLARRDRLPRTRRIRKRREFLRIQRFGRKLGRPGHLVVLVMSPKAGLSRIGITTSRKVGNAVVRNRIKRRVRDYFRRHQHEISPPQDVVVIARESAARVPYASLARDLSHALRLREPI